MTLNSNMWCVNLPVPYLYIMKILTQKISRGGVSTLKPQNLCYLNSLHFIFPITIYNYIHRLLQKQTCGLADLSCNAGAVRTVLFFRSDWKVLLSLQVYLRTDLCVYRVRIMMQRCVCSKPVLAIETSSHDRFLLLVNQ